MEVQKDKAATLFVDQVKPTIEYLRKVREGAATLCKILESQTMYEIGHERIAISMKKLGPQIADCDLFLYINGIMLEDWSGQVRNVAAEFERALTSAEFLVSKGELIRQVEYNGVVYDIIPSLNEGVKGETEKSKEEKAGAEETIESKEFFIYLAPTPPTPFPSAFIDDYEIIIKSTAWLAKYWDSYIELHEYVDGRSTIMELIVVDANANLVDHKDKTLLRCFKRFLRAMAQFADLKIVLSNFYKASDVPSSVRAQRPVIMDPICPYHNLGVLSTGVIRTFEDKARATLKKLSNFERSASFEFGIVFGLECERLPADIFEFLNSD